MNQNAKAKDSARHCPWAKELALRVKMRGAAAVAMHVTASISVAAAVKRRLTTSSPLRRRRA